MRVLFATAALSGAANAFWGTAHMLVSNRAEVILSQEAPDALAAANAVLAPLKTSYPDLVEEGDHSFTECAVFADNIKPKGYGWQNQWHYINIPYFDEGGSLDDYPKFEQPDVDVVAALDSLIKFLKDDSSADDTEYIKEIKSNFSKEEDQKSFALRLVIHYAGDIHQPLHDVAEVDSKYPKGDAGGNFEHLSKVIDGVNCLHAIWDSVAYKYAGYPVLPLTEDKYDWYVSESTSIAADHPIKTSEIKAGDYNAWSQESLVIAKSTVYAGFSDPPTEEYKQHAIDILGKQISLGGKRLSKIIEDIYGNKEAHAVASLLTEILQ